VLVQGITDSRVRITIKDLTTGEICVGGWAAETDREGRFEKEVKLDTALAAHTLEITAEDEVGNQVRRTVELLNDALGRIQELRICTGETDITNQRVSPGTGYPLELEAVLDDGTNIVLNDDTLVEWKQNTVEGRAVLTQEEGTCYLEAEEGARGMVTAHFLVSDLGSVSASFAYGAGSGEEIDLDSDDTTVEGLEETYEYTGEEIRPECRVCYKGEELTAERDYIVQFRNNVEVSGETEHAVLQIVGQGRYQGSKSFSFRIVQTKTPGPSPDVSASPNPDETDTPGGSASPNPDETDTPGGSASPKPGETESPAVTPSPKPGETESPAVTPSPKPGETESPAVTPSPKPGETESPAVTPSPKPGETENPAESTSPVPDGTPEPPVMVGDLTYYDGKYYFYEDGRMAVSKEAFVNGGWRWFDADGTMAVDKDVYQFSSGGKWVRYDGNGSMIKGQDYRYGGWYYFEPFTGAMTKGPAILEDGRKVFYDLENGQMLRGEHTIEGRDYCFDETDGHLISGQETNFWLHIDGRAYWYEGWVRQGWKPADLSYRGKEIYDPVSDAWYWLDNVQNGAKTVGKDVYLEDSLSAYPDHEDGTGKWVRYDDEGRMVKGWDTNESGTYYFETITGAMAKGDVVIDGKSYQFDMVTGICYQEKARNVPHKN